MKFSLNKFLEVPTDHSIIPTYAFIRPGAKTPETLADISCRAIGKIKLPEQMEWTVEDVLNWIDNLGFPHYKETFSKNFIDGKKLISINASALIKMNINDFEDIRTITKSIKHMYGIDKDFFKRPLNLDHFLKFYKSQTSGFYRKLTFCDYLKKISIITCEKRVNVNHFELLHYWLNHNPHFQNLRIANCTK